MASLIRSVNLLLSEKLIDERTARNRLLSLSRELKAFERMRKLKENMPRGRLRSEILKDVLRGK